MADNEKSYGVLEAELACEKRGLAIPFYVYYCRSYASSLRHAFGMELRYVAFYTMLFRPSVSCSTESLLHMQLLLDHPTPCFNIARMARAARAIGKRIPIPRKGLDTQMEPALVPAQATQ